MQHFSQVGAPGTVLTVAYPADLDGITMDGKGTQTQMIPVEIQGQDLCATLVVAAPSDSDKGENLTFHQRGISSYLNDICCKISTFD